MKKSDKKYKPKASPPSKAEEPMILAPIMSRLDFLSDFSPQDLHKKNFSGRILTDLLEETALSANELADVVGVSKSKFYELINADHLNMKSIDAVADFAVLWQKGLNAFEGDQELLHEWLRTRNENLGGIRPVSLLSTRLGRRELEKAFMRIEYSVYG